MREEVDEPSHAEHPLAPSFRPPLPPPELWRTSPVVGPTFPLDGSLSHTAVPLLSVVSATSAPNCPSCLTQGALSAAPSVTSAPDAPSPPPPPLPPPRRWWWSSPPYFCCHSQGCGLRGRDCRCVAVSPGYVPPTIPPGFGDGVGGLNVGHPQGLDDCKGRGGSSLSLIGGTIHVGSGLLH